jgi:sulfonate transport system substrate-binding protein
MTEADVANLTEDQRFMIETGMLQKAKALDIKAVLIAPSAFAVK